MLCNTIPALHRTIFWHDGASDVTCMTGLKFEAFALANGSYLYWDDMPYSYHYTAIVQQRFKIMQHPVSGTSVE